MSAINALQAAQTAGVGVRADGDDLALEASTAPSPEVIDALSRHKAEIIALLRPGSDGWSARDWQDHPHEPLLPFGTESTGHAWLHSCCWPAWHIARKADAIAALVAMGIRSEGRE